MAGFAALVIPDSSPQIPEKHFLSLLGLTARYKQLETSPVIARGKNCMAAKLDSPASIHPGIVHDDQTGSWLLAAGTVVALDGDNHPATLLQNLLESYVNNGIRALESFDGHFALVIYNGIEESLSLVSDPIGLFSIFHGRRGSQIFISSSALAVARQIASQADTLSAEHFLRMGRLDADKTLWQDVKRILAGRVLKIINGRVEEFEYWSPAFDRSTSRLSMEAALDLAVDRFSQTISRSLQREGKVWVDLTGGFDTRLIAVLVDKAKLPFSTYCMGPVGSLDVCLSEKISHEMGWEYLHSYLPDQWDPDQYNWFNFALGRGDGLANTLRFAMTLRGFTSRNTTLKTNVIGVGGENLRGYYWHIEKEKIGRSSQVNFDGLIGKVFSSRIPISVMRQDRTKEVHQELSNFARQLCGRYREFPNNVQLDRFEIYRDAGHGGAYLSAASGTGRSLAPLCFKEPVNFAFSLNYIWKYPHYHIFIRKLLERENKILADIDTTTGGPAIPIRLNNLHRFSPLWKSFTNRAIAIGSKKIFGKALNPWSKTNNPGYPLPAWRDAFRTFARLEGLLNYDTMHSSGLYNREEFMQYVEQDAYNPHPNREFLDHIITVEMAFRETGSSVA